MFQISTMRKPDSNQELLARLLDQAYMEVFPTKTISDHLAHISKHRFVGISCSPTYGLEPTIALVEQLKAQPDKSQFKVIPHIAARMVRDKSHLKEILSRLEAAGVERVFVPSGDAKEPVGKYSDSLQLLRDMAEISHNIIIGNNIQNDPMLGGSGLNFYGGESNACIVSHNIIKDNRSTNQPIKTICDSNLPSLFMSRDAKDFSFSSAASSKCSWTLMRIHSSSSCLVSWPSKSVSTLHANINKLYCGSICNLIYLNTELIITSPLTYRRCLSIFCLVPRPSLVPFPRGSPGRSPSCNLCLNVHRVPS